MIRIVFHANLLLMSEDSKTKINLFLVFVVASIFFAISSLNLSSYLAKEESFPVVEGINTDLLRDKEFWENFLAKNPTYIEGWYEIALIHKNLEDTKSYYVAIEKIQELNPNYEKLRSL